ncbi:hypothetical protein Misp03_41240 [Microbispora sp. NBRC 16548]|nr:hypothetical protein Misp03_41240 [Microbispora sp. NBRC 16548]
MTGLALAILTIFAVAAPAHADPAYAQSVAHAQPRHSIRCASLDACTTKEGSSVPCRSSPLDLIDGTHMRLKDAMVKALGAKGNRTLQTAWEAYRQLFTSNTQRAQALQHGWSTTTPDDVPPHWTAYHRSADCHQRHDRVYLGSAE